MNYQRYQNVLNARTDAAAIIFMRIWCSKQKNSKQFHFPQLLLSMRAVTMDLI